MQDPRAELEPRDDPEGVHVEQGEEEQVGVHDEDGVPAFDDEVGVVGAGDGGGDVGADVGDAGEEGDPGEPGYPALELRFSQWVRPNALLDCRKCWTSVGCLPR